MVHSSKLSLLGVRRELSLLRMRRKKRESATQVIACPGPSMGLGEDF